MSTLTSDGSQLQDSEKTADSADSATPSQPLKSTNAKQSAIQRACEACDSRELINLALSPGGLLDDSLRKRAWPILLGDTSNHASSQEAPSSSQWSKKPRHRDEDQVELDVRRAFIYYPNNRNDKDVERDKQRLSNVITETLRTYPMLCYFQGYHDIVQVLLLVLGDELAPPAVARLSLLRIRDFMLPSLSPALKHLQLLPAILECADKSLCRHLSGTRPFFALAATLTLYAHDIQEYSDIARLYDFLLSQEPAMAIYLFASIILSRKTELLEIPAEEPEMLHFTLSKLPQPLDLEGLISSTVEMHKQYPPDILPSRSWQRVSSLSVLKTARDLHAQQSIEDAQTLLHKQEQRLRIDEFRDKAFAFAWRYRRPAGSVAAAISVGLLSIWLRKSGSDKLLWLYFSRLWA